MTLSSEFLATLSLNSERISHVTSFTMFFLSMLFSVLCPLSFTFLQHRIYEILPDNVSDVHKYDMFDIQHFYTPSSVKSTLLGWGDHGIHLFYVIAFIDVFVFCFAYRAFFIVLINYIFLTLDHYFSKQTMRNLRSTVLVLPSVMVYIDYIEDFAQVAMCYIFQHVFHGSVSAEEDNLWTTSVKIASFLNTVKWIAMIGSLLLFVVFVLLTVYLKLFGKKTKKS
jgi:hypothetical protein